ncbi:MULTISPECIES: DNA damage-inducible protein D [Streptococcus]|uniref:DNA-damage-inducible protein D n=2 Tax=Streptococcus TaxID=1301 RepID=A0A0Z8GB67_STRSU|nr:MULTISPECIES: DNA damage-inducible protein D [Streptococcus]MCK3894269.1 DNA damage-inducible protein D [Streptococcus suis]MCK4030349.1 DNA damage-inducible protein D [Streptococcus suis]MDY7602515.1 DNA damage-inducible protein D [Streptococcus suis]NQG71042.1 DNA damage-inducible protein D [Streptococcus suis]NQH52730.1 DNA damage-inducible protein D [Streptococcus suis]
MNDLQHYDELTFENIKRIDENGVEFWYARELQTVLEYTEWRNFNQVIDKAKLACENSGKRVVANFVDVNKTVQLNFGAREIADIKLSRYACYLIVQNGDPRKEVIALGQSYFAIKTRQQELADNFNKLDEEHKRLAIRQEMKEHNKSLAEAAKMSGVTNYGKFQNFGYKGLYGGMSMQDIHDRKELEKGQSILDYMGSAELAANLFRATQTDEVLRNRQIHDENLANDTHFNVGRTIRKTMQELGTTMPENLPTPQESIQDLKRKHKQLDKQPDENQLSLFDDM